MRQPRPLPPRHELVNAFEFEEVARMMLAPEVFSSIAGSDRAAFDRVTLRPRMCIPVLDMNLTVDLFGDAHFTPILVGPVADQRRFHRDGELATVRGASAAKAGVIVSGRSSAPIADVAREAKVPLWFAVDADGGAAARSQAAAGVAAGGKAVCISAASRVDWRAIDQIRNSMSGTPLILKGITAVADAKSAVERGIHGIVVSNEGGEKTAAAPIAVLPSIVDTVDGKAVVIASGSFRRGSDILKALILGARAVLVARPVMWALAAYGADGVQTLLELLQADLARQIGAIGVANLQGLTRSHLKIHSR